jgi:hypothetical protein
MPGTPASDTPPHDVIPSVAKDPLSCCCRGTIHRALFLRHRAPHRRFERSRPTLFLSRLLLQTCRPAQREISLHLFWGDTTPLPRAGYNGSSTPPRCAQKALTMTQTTTYPLRLPRPLKFPGERKSNIVDTLECTLLSSTVSEKYDKVMAEAERALGGEAQAN